MDLDYQSQVFEKISSIFMQARAKRDLYDTSRMIKEDFEGCRWILRNLKDKHSVLECHRELVAISRDLKVKY